MLTCPARVPYRWPPTWKPWKNEAPNVDDLRKPNPLAAIVCTARTPIPKSALLKNLRENLKIPDKIINRCKDTGFYVGYGPGFAGAHSQGETLDELHENLTEAITLILKGRQEKGLRRASPKAISERVTVP